MTFSLVLILFFSYYSGALAKTCGPDFNSTLDAKGNPKCIPTREYLLNHLRVESQDSLYLNKLISNNEKIMKKIKAVHACPPAVKKLNQCRIYSNQMAACTRSKSKTPLKTCKNRAHYLGSNVDEVKMFCNSPHSDS
jgi:hypothetical protein